MLSVQTDSPAPLHAHMWSAGMACVRRVCASTSARSFAPLQNKEHAVPPPRKESAIPTPLHIV